MNTASVLLRASLASAVLSLAAPGVLDRNLQFGNGILAQKTNRLFYAAGPNEEEDGVFGVISVAFQ